ncbi:MAG: ABC transporter substrate-binding protein, partial [Candidatus Hodarchaeota archaeon]
TRKPKFICFSFGITPKRIGVVTKPELAKSWDISSDGLVYRFHLREGVKWHDGKPFTSADVKFTIEKMVIPYHPLGKRVWANLESITTPDPHTVIITLIKSFPPLIQMLGLGYGFGGIMPKHLFEGTDFFKNPYSFKPVGTGPFVFKEWKRGSHIIFERNRNYWESSLPYLDKIVVQIVPDAATRLTGLFAGQFDQAEWPGIPYGQISKVEASPLLQLSKTPQGAAGLYNLTFNLRDPILKNKKVRQAIAYAIDFNFIKKIVFFDLTKPATAHISSNLGPSYWNENKPLAKYHEQNIEKANRLLDEAGFLRKEKGTRFKLTLTMTMALTFNRDAATVLTKQLAEIGIEIEPRILEYAAFLKKIYTDWDFQLMIHTMSSGPFPEFYVSRLYISSNIKSGVTFSNAAGYSNPEIDHLFKAASTEPDAAKGKSMFYKIQDILAEDIPVLPIWEVYYPLISSTKFHNTGLSPLACGGEFLWGQIWWEKAERTEP